MQDRVKLHSACVVLDFLHETSGDLLMSHHFPWHQVWTHLATSQPIYINHFNFLLQGFVKKKLSMRKCTTLVECKALIIPLYCTVAEDMCQRWSRVHSSWWGHVVIGDHIKLIIH